MIRNSIGITHALQYGEPSNAKKILVDVTTNALSALIFKRGAK